MTDTGKALAAVAVMALVAGVAIVEATKDGAVAVVTKDEPPKTVCVSAPALVCDALDQNAPKGTPQYRRVEVPASGCTTTQKLGDGGTLTSKTLTRAEPDAGKLLVLKDSCEPASAIIGSRTLDGGVKYLSQACSCRAAAGACTAPLLIDGGIVTVPFGVTAKNATGAGCVPKSCIEFAGVTSWPSACPGG